MQFCLVDHRLQALHLSGTASLTTGTRPHSCHIPRQLSINAKVIATLIFVFLYYRKTMPNRELNSEPVVKILFVICGLLSVTL